MISRKVIVRSLRKWNCARERVHSRHRSLPGLALPMTMQQRASPTQSNRLHTDTTTHRTAERKLSSSVHSSMRFVQWLMIDETIFQGNFLIFAQIERWRKSTSNWNDRRRNDSSFVDFIGLIEGETLPEQIKRKRRTSSFNISIDRWKCRWERPVKGEWPSSKLH